jgi:regulation of enolase protein 1 (concanavalin A-like superfamily)
LVLEGNSIEREKEQTLQCAENFLREKCELTLGKVVSLGVMQRSPTAYGFEWTFEVKLHDEPTITVAVSVDWREEECFVRGFKKIS